MTVVQATNRIKVQPNHVYVIPPNKDMSLLHGALHLFEPGAPRGLRLPILRGRPGQETALDRALYRPKTRCTLCEISRGIASHEFGK